MRASAKGQREGAGVRFLVEVAECEAWRPEAQAHRGLVNDLGGAASHHRHAGHLLCVPVRDELDEALRVADGSGAEHEFESGPDFRSMEILVLMVRPGHREDFKELAMTYKAGFAKVPNARFAVLGALTEYTTGHAA